MGKDITHILSKFNYDFILFYVKEIRSKYFFLEFKDMLCFIRKAFWWLTSGIQNIYHKNFFFLKKYGTATWIQINLSSSMEILKNYNMNMGIVQNKNMNMGINKRNYIWFIGSLTKHENLYTDSIQLKMQYDFQNLQSCIV